MAQQSLKQGIWLMIIVTVIFASQDGISRYLADKYNVWMTVTIRFWFLALFVVALASRLEGGIAKASRSGMPKMQILRATVLVVEVLVMIFAFTVLGLVDGPAVFAAYPLLVAVLAGPILGEKMGWRRWGAVSIGFVGVAVILSPGSGVFSLYSLIPLLAATLFAIYSLLTRYVSRSDSSMVSFFWLGIVSAVLLTPFGIYHWEPMTAPDWAWMFLLCLTSSSSHWLLIRAYEVAEASAIQPFAYLQLVWSAIIGVFLFNDLLRINVVIGGAIVVGAGLFTIWRARAKANQG